MNIKSQILCCRVVWAVVLLISMVSTIIAILYNPAVNVLSAKGNISERTCYIDLTFDQHVSNGDIEVAFFDQDGNHVQTQKQEISAYGGKTASVTFLSLSDNVKSYKIQTSSLVFNVSTNIFLYIFPLIFALSFFMFMVSLFFSYKEFEYQGHTISVYAGLYNHILKVDDQLCDEHKSLVSANAIDLSCTLASGEVVLATIGELNSTTLKINNQLYKTQISK